MNKNNRLRCGSSNAREVCPHLALLHKPLSTLDVTRFSSSVVSGKRIVASRFYDCMVQYTMFEFLSIWLSAVLLSHGYSVLFITEKIQCDRLH